ncbi:sterol desaturase family protein [Piscinibacter sp.]|jgi:sterol desaturase/sphingolipid hydroxylase (fatty acid hydroxylase superfamily)|uniref:sterol desaturase family protein n=1 Tax=Piscinibacter sp. TaxID=1903157 RepID=UPI0035597B0A
MDAVDIVGPLVPITYLVMLAIEKWRPARAFPPRRGWAWLGMAFLVLMGVVATVVPLLVPAQWLASHRLIDGSGLGVVGGTVIGYVVLSGLSYIYHRTAHTMPLLWRLTHQIHHSPQRVDISGSMVFHPIEMVIQMLLQLFATLIVLGLDPLAAALTGYVAAFYGLFQHWNVHTPQWLGVLIQRPEAHCEHHRQGVHANNYGDLPIWDILLGTFRNPKTFSGECGFEAPSDKRLWAMLAWRDVNEPVYGSASRGVSPQSMGS